MHISDVGVSLIKKFEGFSPDPYLCPAGIWTIGYGHVMNHQERAAHMHINVEKAHELLLGDVRISERCISNSVLIDLEWFQFDALVSFVYNVGVGAFKRSTMLKLLNQNNIFASAAQFDRWIYANGVILRGLLHRRAAERALFENNAAI